ncbi:hypothetical protein EYF80_045403 [Liparis tanakae]|uniref:Uncharacterized protein n=1 Tax=Liparis tanakae TaxID=230148 RepID=A0A4Z2FU60_9TELE|nr:hypothetical protein EYF80_045403 [Liparis tanakae]
MFLQPEEESSPSDTEATPTAAASGVWSLISIAVYCRVISTLIGRGGVSRPLGAGGFVTKDDGLKGNERRGRGRPRRTTPGAPGGHASCMAIGCFSPLQAPDN